MMRFAPIVCLMSVGAAVLAGPAAAASNDQFNLVCKFRLLAGKGKINGNGPPSDFDGNFKDQWAVDLKRKLYSDMDVMKQYRRSQAISAFDENGVTLQNDQYGLKLWDRKSGRYYETAFNEDGTARVLGGSCTVVKYTPF